MRSLTRLLPLLGLVSLGLAETPLIAQQPGQSASQADTSPGFESLGLEPQRVLPLPAPSPSAPLAPLWTAEGQIRPENAHISQRTVAEPSIRRHVGWGALLGAGAGVVSGLLVRSACDGLCDESVAEGMALHVGVGALVGGAAGALVYWIR